MYRSFFFLSENVEPYLFHLEEVISMNVLCVFVYRGHSGFILFVFREAISFATNSWYYLKVEFFFIYL